jgi:SAM-dependent methyltransferase
MDAKDQIIDQYEHKYQHNYGVVYPESHIIRTHKHILEWELGIFAGNVFDFGCGIGTHLKYFADHSFIPYGCDTSRIAIARCQQLLPAYTGHFFVTPRRPNLLDFVAPGPYTLFLSNQVLYYLEDRDIRDVVRQAYILLRPGGVFIATMMAYSCWFARYITGEVGDFKRVELQTPRQQETTLINFKHRHELLELFQPFRKLHLGSYGSHIREEEGPIDHWLFVGLRD